MTMSSRSPGAGVGPATRTIRDWALELGFDRVGFAAVTPSDHGAAYRDWVERGLHGEMGYLARPDAISRRLDLRRTLESVKSAVVVAHDYGSTESEAEPAGAADAIVARYARGRDYHRVITPRLRTLHGRIQQHFGADVSGRAYVDTGPLLERELAHRAGLGWFGRNTMLIHPTHGSYFFIGILLLGIELDTAPSPVRDHCGSCRACLDGCPTGALLGRTSEGAPVMDARRCISYLTIELRGAIPAELREGIGNRVFGCDICQETCPFNRKFAAPPLEPGYAAPSAPDSAPRPLLELASASREEWDQFTRGRPIRRARYEGLRRNVMVGLGNWGDPAAIPALAEGLGDESALVRAHAAWALGRVRHPDARVALEATRETDPEVRSEIGAALRSFGPS